MDSRSGAFLKALCDQAWLHIISMFQHFPIAKSRTSNGHGGSVVPSCIMYETVGRQQKCAAARAQRKACKVHNVGNWKNFTMMKDFWTPGPVTSQNMVAPAIALPLTNQMAQEHLAPFYGVAATKTYPWMTMKNYLLVTSPCYTPADMHAVVSIPSPSLAPSRPSGTLPKVGT
jgi:hypothetical protein